MPKVSVLVAARDAATTVEEALRSVAAQEAVDWECIVVDDGSTDGTTGKVTALAAQDPRFHVLIRPAEGVVPARNAGLQACRGAFIAIFDADDLMLPRRLTEQAAVLEGSTHLAAVGSHVEYFPRRLCGEGRLAYEAWLNGQEASAGLQMDRFVEMPLGHPTLMFRAEVLQDLGYRDMGWPEDWDLLLRVYREGLEMGIVPAIHHRWRLSPGSLSRDSPSYTEDAFTRCRAHFLAQDFLSDQETYGLLGYGQTGKALRKALLPHSKTCAAIYELHPGRIGQVIDGAEVWHHERLLEPVPHRLLVSVAGSDARAFLRERLRGWGYLDGVDFVCTA